MFEKLKNRESISPLLRGALFYSGFWGVIGSYEPFLNVYLVDLGLSGTQIGILSGLLPLMTLIFAPVVSRYADLHAKRVPLLAMMLACLAVSIYFLSFPHRFILILPFMLLVALFRSPVAPLGDSLLARMAFRYSVDYGKMRLWGSFTFAIISILFGVVWEIIGFSSMFFIAGLLFIFVVYFALLLDETPVVFHVLAKPWEVIKGNPKMLTTLAATFLVGASIQIAIVFSAIYMKYLGGNDIMVGMLVGFSAFSELPTMLFSDAILRRLGGKNTLLVAYGILMIAFFSFARVQTPALLLVANMVKGLGFGLFFVSTVIFLDRQVPEKWSSTIQAAMNAGAFGLAPLIASPIGGIIWDRLGPEMVFLACSVIILFAGFVLLFS